MKAKRPLIISGPCSAETEEQTLETCRRIAATGLVDVLRAGIWKPRTKPGSFEGVGLRGLAWMSRAREETGLPIGTEVATSKHVEAALEFGVDVIWLGARTTVNPFSVQDIADARCRRDGAHQKSDEPRHRAVGRRRGAHAQRRHRKAGAHPPGLLGLRRVALPQQSDVASGHRNAEPVPGTADDLRSVAHLRLPRIPVAGGPEERGPRL